jgi:peptidyl-prolyl cis-trans isomerase C
MATYINDERVDPALIAREQRELQERYEGEGGNEEDSEARRERIEKDALANAIEKTLLQQQARLHIPNVPMKKAQERLNLMKRRQGGAEKFYAAVDLTPKDDPRIKEQLREQIRLERYYNLISADAGPPEESDCMAYYEAHPGKFTVPEQVRVSHIVQQPGGNRNSATVFSEMLNIREALLKGADFDELARQTSQCGESGIDLGYVSRGRMLTAFETVVFALEPGQISDVFHTSYGYHVAKVFDKTPERLLPYDEVRDDLHGLLLNHRKNARIGEKADELLKEAVIEERDDA